MIAENTMQINKVTSMTYSDIDYDPNDETIDITLRARFVEQITVLETVEVLELIKSILKEHVSVIAI